METQIKNLFVRNGDQDMVIYSDQELSNPVSLLMQRSELIRAFTKADWIGGGEILDEYHGNFLSQLSICENNFKTTHFRTNRLNNIFEKVEGDNRITELFKYDIKEIDVSIFANEIVKIYKKSLDPKEFDLENVKNFVHNIIMRVVLSTIIEISEITPPEGEEEEVSLSDISHYEEGKLLKLNGEIIMIKNIMEEDPTNKKILVPVRFKERYGEKGNKEDLAAIRKLEKINKTLMMDVLKNHGKLHHLKHRVPEHDPTFLLNRPEYMDFIKLFTAHGFSKILLSGDAGVGKSELVQQVCSRMNMPLIRVDFSGEVIAEQILWSQNYNPETKKMEVVEGVIPYCVRNGIKLCLEEFSAIPPSVAFELHRLMEKGELYIKDNDTLITPHPNFSIVATDNRIGNPNFQKYFGTQQQNSALISRINQAIWIPYPTKSLEKGYLSLKFDGLDELVVKNENGGDSGKLLDLVVDFANDVRPKYMSGELGFTISPRDIVSFFDSFYKLEDLKKAFEYAILNFHRGFKTDEQAIQNLFDKYFGKKPIVDLISNINKVKKLKNENILKKVKFLNEVTVAE